MHQELALKTGGEHLQGPNEDKMIQVSQHLHLAREGSLTLILHLRWPNPNSIIIPLSKAYLSLCKVVCCRPDKQRPTNAKGNQPHQSEASCALPAAGRKLVDNGWHQLATHISAGDCCHHPRGLTWCPGPLLLKMLMSKIIFTMPG